MGKGHIIVDVLNVIGWINLIAGIIIPFTVELHGIFFFIPIVGGIINASLFMGFAYLLRTVCEIRGQLNTIVVHSLDTNKP